MTPKTTAKITKTNQIIAVLTVLLLVVVAWGLYWFLSPDNNATSPSSAASEETVAETQLEAIVAQAKTQAYTLYTDLEQGSGFLINNKGDILTNAHVVLDGSFITVKNSDGQEFNGVVIGMSETEDLAIVRVDRLAGKEPLEIEMEPVDVGTPVIAIGSPNDESNTVTTGEIAATNIEFSDEYEYTELYEMTAEIAQGSSGGPLISANTGKILGINSIILQEKPESGYAIPMYTIWEQLIEWINNPLVTEEQEIILQDIRDPYFEEDLLANFITDYFEMLPYTFNDEIASDYSPYVAPSSKAETKASEMDEEYTQPDRTYETIETTINAIDINETSATIEADAELTYQDEKNDTSSSVTHQGVYTVTINQYGDYQIEDMINQ
ncbi:S1C family serine protease [Planococcus versutus]|uniref:Serine protease n=1 Tax=Planococcus versutus TaxID=1302659 RepID=A0A1B1S2W4_9BACL|nr:S1C family serine protease [Planococcus versutus]ANU27526.1 serine protease [Planococcus versutus]